MAPVLLALWVVFGVGMVGCAQFQALLAPKHEQPQGMSQEELLVQAREQDTFLLAQEAFSSGEYARAAELYGELSGSSREPDLARRAAYGEAAALYAVASTPQDYAMAEAAWQDWVRMLPAEPIREDPRKLSPALGKLSQNAAREAEMAKQVAAAQAEAAKLKKGAADGATKLTEQEAEIARLRDQIESLKQLHREMLEKKRQLGQ